MVQCNDQYLCSQHWSPTDHQALISLWLYKQWRPGGYLQQFYTQLLFWLWISPGQNVYKSVILEHWRFMKIQGIISMKGFKCWQSSITGPWPCWTWWKLTLTSWWTAALLIMKKRLSSELQMIRQELTSKQTNMFRVNNRKYTFGNEEGAYDWVCSKVPLDGRIKKDCVPKVKINKTKYFRLRRFDD